MAQVTVYVPEEMKARMVAAGDVNWSAEAQRAFAMKLRNDEWKAQMDENARVIGRWKADKEKREQSDTEEGRHCGRRWARTSADYHAVKRLAQAAEAGIEDANSDEIFNTLVGDDDGAYPDSSEFWQHACGDDVPSDATAQGFVEGALEVWDELADKV